MGDQRATVPSGKKSSIYVDDFLSHGMSVLSQYFHLVSTECKMTKILDIFDYLKYNKRNLKKPFKSQNGNKYLQLNFIDYILTPNSSVNMLLQTLNVFSLHVYIYIIVARKDRA